jgi:hypothetical protein
MWGSQQNQGRWVGGGGAELTISPKTFSWWREKYSCSGKVQELSGGSGWLGRGVGVPPTYRTKRAFSRAYLAQLSFSTFTRCDSNAPSHDCPWKRRIANATRT